MQFDCTTPGARVSPAGNLPPTVKQRISLLYKRRRISPHKQRLLGYLVENPKALTHEIAHRARISYPPSPIAQLNRDLPSVGLLIQRMRPVNHMTAECRWRLIKLSA